MADGTTKPIEQIVIGDLVLGHSGPNRVTGIEYPRLGTQPLYGFNGGRPFVTASHPFLTNEGWKAIDPTLEVPRIPWTLGRLAVGHHVLTVAGMDVQEAGQLQARPTAVPLVQLEPHPADPATPLYNLLVDGDYTYIADSWFVSHK